MESARLEEMDLENPFLLFPEEVWAMILGKVEDSKDIQNAFKAFPELEGVMSNTRHLWMSDQAMPHLALWLEGKELLSFRQVCKPWFRAVDNFLENHPSQRPCSSAQEPLLTGQIWIPQAAPQPHYKFELPIAERAIYNPGDISSFRAHFSGHSQDRNPFVGRSLFIGFGEKLFSRRQGISLDEYVQEVKELLQEYGQHVWFISFVDEALDKQGLFDSFVEIVRDCLPYTPNLKGLRMASGVIYDEDYEESYSYGSGSSYEFDSEEEEAGEDAYAENQDCDEAEEAKKEETKKKTYTGIGILGKEPNQVLDSNEKSDALSLPHLETLQLDLNFLCNDPNGVSTLILDFSTQLRRLEIPLNFWSQSQAHSHSNFFPNLMELLITGTDKDAPKEDLANLLSNLNAPKLTTLSLVRYVHWATETDIVGWLKRFPEIRSFVLLLPFMWVRVREIGEKLTPPTPSQLITSLTSLKFGYAAVMNYDMLLYFPSLEYLRIEQVPVEPEQPLPSFNAKINARGGGSIVKFERCLLGSRMYESNVWELLPKLKMITVSTSPFLSPSVTHFTRATYDQLRNGANPQ